MEKHTIKKTTVHELRYETYVPVGDRWGSTNGYSVFVFA